MYVDQVLLVYFIPAVLHDTCYCLLDSAQIYLTKIFFWQWKFKRIFFLNQIIWQNSCYIFCFCYKT